jgi:glycosyltransferase involved in cell wall biosynthesis
MPQVTLCLPIYNAERFLAEAVQSIRAQTFTDFEVIAVLDGCTDKSEEMLRAEIDERFTIVKKTQNEGVVAASNLALARARAPLYGRMDADDLMDLQRLQLQVQFMNVHPEVDVLGTWFDIINERGDKIKDAFPFSISHNDIKEEFRVRDAIGGATAISRTKKLKAVHGYGAAYTIAEDYALWLKCLAHGYCFANLPVVLYHYRTHTTQSSEQRRNEMLRLTNLAYEEFGSLIWGDRAPDVHLGEPLLGHIIRKLRHVLSGKR